MEVSPKVDILLVDDRPDNFTVLEAVLDSPLYNLVRATSGSEAINIAGKSQFAVILLDVQMPDKDGFQTAREIRLGGGRQGILPSSLLRPSTATMPMLTWGTMQVLLTIFLNLLIPIF